MAMTNLNKLEQRAHDAALAYLSLSTKHNQEFLKEVLRDGVGAEEFINYYIIWYNMFLKKIAADVETPSNETNI